MFINLIKFNYINTSKPSLNYDLFIYNLLKSSDHLKKLIRNEFKL